MSETPRRSSAVSHDAEQRSAHGIVAVHGVRYQVKDVGRAVAFYTGHLGFSLEHQQPPRLRACRSAASRCCSVDQEHRDRGRCPTVDRRNRADGIGWSSA